MEDWKDKKELNELLDYKGLTHQQRRQRQNENLDELSNALKLYLQSGIENQLLQELAGIERQIDSRHYALQQEVAVCFGEGMNGEQTPENVFRWMEEAAYLSQLKRMLSIYHEEQRKKEEKRQFQYYTRRSQNLPAVVRAVVKGAVSVQDLERTQGLKARSLNQVVNRYTDLFPVNERNQQVFVSLSHKGSRYHNYISIPQEKQDMEVCQKLIYSNCNTIMKAIGTLIRCGEEIPRPLKLVELNLDQERALKRQYRVLAQNINMFRKQSMPVYCPVHFPEGKTVQKGCYVPIYKDAEGERNGEIGIQVKSRTWREGEGNPGYFQRKV